MATASTAQSLTTAEEYLELACQTDKPTELVRGRMVVMNPPFPWHGYVCGKVDRIIGGFIETNDLGYPVTNDGGIITERDPDTVRGADVAFYSYKRVPKGTMPKRGYAPDKPDWLSKSVLRETPGRRSSTKSPNTSRSGFARYAFWNRRS
jgi:Uma2 family endonuclease